MKRSKDTQLVGLEAQVYGLVRISGLITQTTLVRSLFPENRPRDRMQISKAVRRLREKGLIETKVRLRGIAFYQITSEEVGVYGIG
jgi:hypothetical protein